MYRHHHHGYWGGGWGGGWGWGWGGPFVRRAGFPLFGGGLGLGGGGLLGDLMAGGLGYMVGRQQAMNQQNQQNQQYQQYQPQYQQPYQQPVQQYQQPAPQYQQPVQGNAQSGQLAQLNLLGQLREQGILTNDEFEREKQKILNGF
jgi:hypothetical protein